MQLEFRNRLHCTICSRWLGNVPPVHVTIWTAGALMIKKFCDKGIVFDRVRTRKGWLNHSSSGFWVINFAFCGTVPSLCPNFGITFAILSRFLECFNVDEFTISHGESFRFESFIHYTGRLLDIRTTLKLGQTNVCARMVSESSCFRNKFSYEITAKDSTPKYSKSATPWVFH